MLSVRTMSRYSKSALAAAVLVLIVFSEVEGQTPQPSRPSNCTAPPIVPNSNHTTNGLTDGSIATYICAPRYEATGSLQRTCRNGLWISGGADLSCSSVSCPRPPYITGGSSTASSFLVGAVAPYNCYTGYVLNGSVADVTCLPNKTWTQPTPVCSAKDCGVPPAIEGGNASYTTTKYFSSATYTCRNGYDLANGDISTPSRRIRCQSTGEWSLPPVCKPRDCGLPSNIENGVRFSMGNHVYGQKVSYNCNFGYILQGDSEITCLSAGRWSALPQCMKRSCASPPSVSNATYQPVVQAFYGDAATYKCAKGFEIIGSLMVNCGGSGTWTQPPSCVLVDCRTPPSIHFGVHTWTKTTYSSLAEYKCDEGYKLIGVPEIHCQYDGRWTDSPTCELPPGQSPGLPSKTAQTSGQTASSENTPAFTGLAIACALLAAVTLVCLILLIYKLFIADKAEKLFSYTSHKNGDGNANSNV